MADTHRCPRRDEVPSDNWSFSAGPDDFDYKHTCPFCGSIHPDRFMDMVRSGTEIGTTTKSYKAYIGNGKFYYQHLSREQMQEFVDLYNQGKVKTDFPFNPNPFFMIPAGS